MSLAETFILAGSHGVAGALGWLLCDVRYKARQERSRMKKAAVREWSANLQREAELSVLRDELPPAGHPGYERLLLELGARMECPPDPSGLEVDMVAEQNRKAAEWAVIDLRDPSDGAR